MKQGLYLAFVYVGLVIGAGFASGREIMEYFNLPSRSDYGGIVLASFLLIAICRIILRRAYLEGIGTGNGYLKAVAGKYAPFVNIFMLLFMFCGFFTMLSGSGALLSQSFLLPDIIGILFLAALCFLVLIFDLKGIVAVNTILVPCMIIGIFYICISAALFGVSPSFAINGGVITSSVCYVSYNTISAAPVLVPLQKEISEKGIRIAAISGGFILGLLIFIIWTTQNLYFDALWNSELPMLKLAAISGRTQKSVYTLVLFMAICTTAISQGFGILSAFSTRSLKERVIGAGALCIIAIPFSLLGFSTLVKYLYSFFGFLGLIWALWLIIEYFIYIKNI